MVPYAIATVLGVSLPVDDSGPALCVCLSDVQRLLVLDNGEHVVHAVAPLLEQVLNAAPAVRRLATSREPVSAGGEWVYRLPAGA